MKKFLIKIYLTPWAFFKIWRAKRINKKVKKDEFRYPEQWKNDYVLKQIKKINKIFRNKINVHGYDNIPSKGIVIFVVNHQSSFDPLILIQALKKQTGDSNVNNKMSVFLAKKEINENKYFKNHAQLLSTHFIDRNKPKESLKTIIKLGKYARENKKNIVIFPEGTRSNDGNLKEFKSGAFSLAKKEFIPIIPVTINNSLSASDKNRENILDIDVYFHKIIKPMTFISQDSKKISDRIKIVINSKLKEPIRMSSNEFEKKA